MLFFHLYYQYLLIFFSLSSFFYYSKAGIYIEKAGKYAFPPFENLYSISLINYFPDEVYELSRQSATFRFRAMLSVLLPVSHDNPVWS